MVSLSFSDGSSLLLPPISDSSSFSPYEYRLDELQGKSIVSIDLINNNTRLDISLKNIELFNPVAVAEQKPLNAISTAQDAIIAMEGIEVPRPGNTIDDLVPGLTLTLKKPSERPVSITVEPDREGVKNAIITFVANYNRLMAEINVLTARSLASAGLSTRVDDSIINELTYLSAEEAAQMRERLGAFQTDSTLSSFRNMLRNTISTPYPTSMDRELALLSQIGIGTDIGRGGASTGYDPSRLRGYLDIDEKVLDAAIAANPVAIKELFGSDTNGDLLVDTGIAFNLENLTRPYVETGGIISLKTRTVDTRISSEQRRVDTMDRQLAAKETELRLQYAQMENAYNRMEQMSQSLDNFSRQNNNNNGR
jgi:flagellar hook-associated protein 2